MNKQFMEILNRVNDPKQVKSINDVSRVVIVPALAHLEERIEKVEELLDGINHALEVRLG